MRQAEAWRLLTCEAKTFEQIGAALGVSSYTAWHDVEAARKRLEAQGILDADLRRAMQDAEIQVVKRAHLRTPKQKASAEVLLGIWTREARLLGLDRPARDAVPVEQMLALVKGVVALVMDLVGTYVDAAQQDAARQAFVARLRAQAGPLALAPVPEPESRAAADGSGEAPKA